MVDVRLNDNGLEQSSMEAQQPLRAVILDNDETTGSYTIVFGILLALQTIPNLPMTTVATILQRLGTWMIRNQVFRPGLRYFLKSLLELKRQGKIDTVIMYTNQKESPIPSSYTNQGTDYLPLLWSVPLAIAYMFCYLMGDIVVDVILSRPDTVTYGQNQVILKYWTRIFEMFPDRPHDIRSMIFFDDMACPKYISADGIPRHAVQEDCWYRVQPYYRSLNDREIYDCLHHCFKDLDIVDSLFDKIYFHYICNCTIRNSTPNTKIFLEAAEACQAKFGTVEVRTAEIPSLLPSP